MSVSSIVVRGYGSWGTVNDVPTLGYGIGTVVVPPSTGRPFYRPGSVSLADYRIGSVIASDSRLGSVDGRNDRILSADEQVQ